MNDHCRKEKTPCVKIYQTAMKVQACINNLFLDENSICIIENSVINHVVMSMDYCIAD
jgi:hypothetical protein